MAKIIKCLNASVRGASHILAGKVCQDASYAWCDSATGMAMALVSDGHGDQRCDRSDIGAWLAVEVGKITLRDFANVFSTGRSDREFDKHARQLFASIVYEWQRGIAYDLGTDAQQLSHEQVHRYGCTLIGYLQIPHGWFAFQIGDGKLTMRDRNGQWTQPVPWDDACVANITTSLCQRDALQHFHYALGTEMPSAVCLGSDGIDDSFGDGEGLSRFYEHLVDSILIDGLSTVKRQLPRVLKHYSEVASHDDMSVSTIINF